jgi:hypothetical protein
MRLNNTLNNDMTVERIHYRLYTSGIMPTISLLKCQLRCMRHVINFVIKAILFEREKLVLETTIKELAL